jgi:uncharacterized RDD family membrane protein YckC
VCTETSYIIIVKHAAPPKGPRLRVTIAPLAQALWALPAARLVSSLRLVRIELALPSPMLTRQEQDMPLALATETPLPSEDDTFPMPGIVTPSWLV